MRYRYKQDFLHAGAAAREVRAYGKSLIKKGASYNEVISKINHKIIELGVRAAFPPQMALNNVAAHFLPNFGEDIIFNNDVVKLDIGICHNGAIGDCAVTVDLSGKYQKLIDAVEAALLNAEKTIKVGVPISEIGKVIDATITSYGYKPVKNLCGHGLGHYRIHMPPTIPNYDDGTTITIKPGMTFAIEPFATDGKGLIYETGIPTIFSFINARSINSEIPRKLVTKIKTFDGLPFAKHDLMELGLSLAEVDEGINELLNAKVIAGYPPLLEKGSGFVAQAENSILVDEKGIVTVTTR